jgi:hypothetical protein
MKRLLLLTLAALPLFAFGGDFVYVNDGPYDYDYWYDEYWEDEYWYDGYWVYYPHGYYCVHFVWWYPWWWDWFWLRCHWCHSFSWDFFCNGFYVGWYEDGMWWYRPRYGRWVRYRLPHSYYTVRYKARQHGIYLPEKPPREISIPYKEHEIMNLAKQQDPELFRGVEKEHKTGNLERMRKDYEVRMNKEITKKNQEYQMKANKTPVVAPPVTKRESSEPRIQVEKEQRKQVYTEPRAKEAKEIQRPRIIKKEKSKPEIKETPKRYEEERTAPKSTPRTPSSYQQEKRMSDDRNRAPDKPRTSTKKR